MTSGDRRRWPSVLLVVGGLLMALLWIRFTTLHGPTSFNEDGHWLGGSSIFWGGMIGFASLLIVLGLYGYRNLLGGVVVASPGSAIG